MLRYLTGVAFRRGALGGSRGWTIVGAAVVALRVVGRLAAREPEVVYHEQLEPGQTLVISHLPPEARR